MYVFSSVRENLRYSDYLLGNEIKIYFSNNNMFNGGKQNMKKNWRCFGLVFLALCVLGLAQGCAELEELRTANRRQAITIRDQMDELDKLEMGLDANVKLNKAYEDRARADEELKKRLRAELENLASAIGGGATVRDTIEGPVIQLPEKILFDSGLAEIKGVGKLALSKIADHIKSKHTTYIRIDGHTDSDPILKSKYLWRSNHHLSAGRALSVFQYLVNKENVDGKRIHIAGYGPNRSIASNNTKAGKRKNRRVEFLILPVKAEKKL